MKDMVATCTSLLPDGAPDWVKLMPSGDVLAMDGRAKWQNSAPAFVVANSQAAIDLVIDYEHQTDLAAKNGQPAPAAGWIKALEARDDGIWGRVEWNDKAKAHLKAKEYRYLSPSFYHDQARNVTRIIRAALTNNPAIHELPALANAQEPGTHVMNAEEMKALALALGLPETATAADITKAATANAQALATATAQATAATATVKATCTALGVDEAADGKAIATAVDALKATAPKAGEFVALATYQETAKQLKALQDGVAADKATAVVEKAMASGQLAPAQKDWALSFATSDAAGFAKFLETQPVIVSPTSAMPGKGVPAMASAQDIANKAIAYQADMQGKGINVSTVQAVEHVSKGGK